MVVLGATGQRMRATPVCSRLRTGSTQLLLLVCAVGAAIGTGVASGQAVDVAAGQKATCTVSVGRVKCFGDNQFGELGLEDTINRGNNAGDMGSSLPAVNLGTDFCASEMRLSTTGFHGCAKEDQGGGLKCWGRGLYGQLGQENTNTTGDEANEMGDFLPRINLTSTNANVSTFGLGTLHTCAVLSWKWLKCFGHNGFARLGLGDVATRGDDPGEMGDALPFVDLGSSVAAVHAVSAGDSHTCALMSFANASTVRAVKCWGRSNWGQLGYEDTVTRGASAASMGNSLPAVALASNAHAMQLSLGDWHSCALLNDSTVKCWGYNDHGQLGYGDIDNRGDDAGEMGDSLAAVDVIGSATGVWVVSISAGFDFTCAVLSDGSGKCWGENTYGELGQGDTADRGDGGGEMGDSLVAIQLGPGVTMLSISAGEDHTCASTWNGTAHGVKCWGRNNDGQLGQEDTVQRGDGAGEMGAALPAVNLSTFAHCGVSQSPTLAPSVSPTPIPSNVPSVPPTAAPTLAPTVPPTVTPTAVPTAAPTVAPTVPPTVTPTAVPTAAPTVAPTVPPTVTPTAVPTANPTVAPTTAPTAAPTAVPTAAPTAAPTAVPTVAPTTDPTVAPTTSPTAAATPGPTNSTDDSGDDDDDDDDDGDDSFAGLGLSTVELAGAAAGVVVVIGAISALIVFAAKRQSNDGVGDDFGNAVPDKEIGMSARPAPGPSASQHFHKPQVRRGSAPRGVSGSARR